MKNGPTNHRRGDLQRAFERDFGVHERRESSEKAFWQSLRILGSVGWPIALLAVGGALLGHWLDEQWHTRFLCALTLIILGVGIGWWTAWRIVKGNHR